MNIDHRCHRRAFIQSLLASAVWSGQATAAPWLSAFKGVAEADEHGFRPVQVTGTFPEDLRGTLYRAGPMRFSSVDGEPYGHWFDGDGGVLGFRITGAKEAEVALRLVDSVGLQKEQQKGRRIYSGYGSGAPNAIWKVLTNQFKNVANTNVIQWDDELWALVESHGPTRLHPDTLVTRGESVLGGGLRGGFSAHPHRIAGRPDLFNLGITFRRSPKLDLYHLLPGQDRPQRIAIANPGTPFVHDFALTANHAIVFLPPITVDFAAVFQHQGAVTPGMKWNADAGTEVVIIPLDDPHRQRRFRVDSFYTWHIGNAYERGDQLIVDAVVYPNFDSNTALGSIPSGTPNQGELNGILTRLTISPTQERIVHSPLMDKRCEFPQVSPRVWGHHHNDLMVASFSSEQASRRGIQDQLSLVKCDTGAVQHLSLGEGTFTGEVVLVPKKKDPSQSWMLAVVLDTKAHRSALHVLDSAALSSGPIASAVYPGVLPFTFHGHWWPA